MKKLAFASVLALGCLSASIAARAADTTVSVGPMYKLAEPYLVYAFGLVVSAAIGWIALAVQKYTGIVATNSAKASLQQAATNAAGRVLASLEPRAMGMRIDVQSPLIAAEIPKLQESMGGVIDMLGVTPDRLGNLIAGKIGILQAAALPSTTPAPPTL